MLCEFSALDAFFAEDQRIGKAQMRKSSVVALPASAHGASPAQITALLAKLRSAESENGWQEFLLQYSGVLYQTVKTLAQDEDDVADCFVYICEQLAKDRCRRLLRFKPDGAASFVTWLRVVARNLSCDWHRKQHGRLRPFRILQCFPPLEQEAYRCRFERHLSRAETLLHLRSTWPGVNEDDLTRIEERIEDVLNPAQRWILSLRAQALQSNVPVGDDVDSTMLAVADPAPSPESVVENAEQRRTLQRCVEALPKEQQLVLRLRFEDELSLDEIARLTGLGDAQRVHRRLAAILQALRSAIANSTTVKPRATSVK